MTWKTLSDDKLKTALDKVFTFRPTKDERHELRCALSGCGLQNQDIVDEVSQIQKHHIRLIYMSVHKKREDYERQAKNYDNIAKHADRLLTCLIDQNIMRDDPLNSLEEIPPAVWHLFPDLENPLVISDYLQLSKVRAHEKALSLRECAKQKSGNLNELDAFCFDLMDFVENQTGMSVPVSSTGCASQLLMTSWNIMYRFLKEICGAPDVKPQELYGDAACRSLQRRVAVRNFQENDKNSA